MFLRRFCNLTTKGTFLVFFVFTLRQPPSVIELSLYGFKNDLVYDGSKLMISLQFFITLFLIFHSSIQSIDSKESCVSAVRLYIISTKVSIYDSGRDECPNVFISDIFTILWCVKSIRAITEN